MSTPGIIVVKSVEQKASAVIPTMPVESVDVQSASQLVFHRYGSTYVLSQIWTEGDSCGRQGAVSRRERELAARQKAPDETILVALR